MKESKKAFIEFMLKSDVLRFGNFITKSGRETPYFINTGFYNDGSSILTLGKFYAECIEESVQGNITTVYGPSYKGIPLAVGAAAALAEQGRNLHYSFNRKEAKDHGEGGLIVGYTPKDGDDVVIVDDVITSGISTRESIELLRATADVNIKAVVISVDRMERGNGEKPALREIEEEYGVPIFPILTIEEVVDYIYNEKDGGRSIIDDDMKRKIDGRICR